MIRSRLKWFGRAAQGSLCILVGFVPAQGDEPSLTAANMEVRAAATASETDVRAAAMAPEMIGSAPRARFVTVRPQGKRFIVDVSTPAVDTNRSQLVTINPFVVTESPPRKVSPAWELNPVEPEPVPAHQIAGPPRDLPSVEWSEPAAPADFDKPTAQVPPPLPAAVELPSTGISPSDALSAEAPAIEAPAIETLETETPATEPQLTQLPVTEAPSESAPLAAELPAPEAIALPAVPAEAAPESPPSEAPPEPGPSLPEMGAFTSPGPAPGPLENAEPQDSLTEATPVPPAPAPPRRIAGPATPSRLATLDVSPEAMQVVGRQAEIHTRRGFELGARGSLFAARAEFLTALEIVVQALDAAGATSFHSTAMAAGLRTLDEVDDFLPQGTARGGITVSVAEISAAHQTPILRDSTNPSLTPLIAAQRYYTYAQQQLSAAVEAQPAGSRALYGLGKTYTALARQQATLVRGSDSKAVVWHQAALLADPRNFAAANDLAVLVARWGKLTTACELLQHSVAVAPCRETWQNLAAVHRALGEAELADSAVREAQRLGAGSTNAPTVPYQLQWVSPDQFGRVAPAPMQGTMARQPSPVPR